MLGTLDNQSSPAWYSEANRARFLTAAGLLIAAIATLDWQVKVNVGLGFLYLIPILLASAFLSRWQILILAVGCAILREAFSDLPRGLQSVPRIANVWVGFFATGLFVHEMARNRLLAVRHLRQLEHQMRLRQDAEEQLQVLINSSPAAILAVDAQGKILLANEAAQQMLAFESQSLKGESIDPHLPVLSAILHSSSHEIDYFRTVVESRGRRRNGEMFLAHVWLSTYQTSSGPRLAAIVLDASEELRDREQSGLHQLLTSSRILVGAVSHEIRNLAAAIGVLYANLIRIPELQHNEDFKALGALMEGLRKIASAELHPAADGALAGVDLRVVLDDLRIVIDTSLHESEIALSWQIPEQLPLVRGDHHRLLQVFLNLAQNSQRAMQDSARKLLSIQVSADRDLVTIRFRDTGPGIKQPDLLFQPFQQGADVVGLGLYVSRAVVRAFAGELRYEAQPEGSCFAVDLLRATLPGRMPS